MRDVLCLRMLLPPRLQPTRGSDGLPTVEFSLEYLKQRYGLKFTRHERRDDELPCGFVSPTVGRSFARAHHMHMDPAAFDAPVGC